MFWGMAFIKVEFTILLMGVFYNSLKSLRALVCEREKTYLLFTLAQVSHEEKYFAEKEVFESKYFFFG